MTTREIVKRTRVVETYTELLDNFGISVSTWKRTKTEQAQDGTVTETTQRSLDPYKPRYQRNQELNQNNYNQPQPFQHPYNYHPQWMPPAHGTSTQYQNANSTSQSTQSTSIPRPIPNPTPYEPLHVQIPADTTYLEPQIEIRTLTYHQEEPIVGRRAKRTKERHPSQEQSKRQQTSSYPILTDLLTRTPEDLSVNSGRTYEDGTRTTRHHTTAS
ncbi:hypothetical protein M569_08738 [Genlisea aurea]|uniref:Uncharacterized protein n=1 Tax=Genlisea aurea TaxID=192259 RepID=S8CGG7_9LAMI|nr:hypothetical protein M569_08738 [Genlisea aurea]